MADIFSNYPGDDTSTTDAVPSYLAGADLHNIGNSQSLGLILVLGVIELRTVLSLVLHLLYLAPLSCIMVELLSPTGLVTIQETVDIQKVMTNLDSNLGEYYSQNQQGIDSGSTGPVLFQALVE